jgi:hypothetical protein
VYGEVFAPEKYKNMILPDSMLIAVVPFCVCVGPRLYGTSTWNIHYRVAHQVIDALYLFPCSLTVPAAIFHGEVPSHQLSSAIYSVPE